MQTIYDWATVGLFCALITLFLHRSIDIDEPRDSLWQYLVAAVGCAFANWLGNEGYRLWAVVAFFVTIAFIWYVLKPLSPNRRP